MCHYIWTSEGWLYLVTVMDLYSRRIVGWAMADHMRTELCLDALQMAIKQRTNTVGLVHHSDRGVQGGFNRSSQHVKREKLRWGQASVGSLIARYVHRCVHRVARLLVAASIDSDSGKESLAA